MNSRSLLIGNSAVAAGLYMIFGITSEGVTTLLPFEYGPTFIVIQAILSFNQSFMLFISIKRFGTVPHLIFSLTEASLIVATIWSIKFSIVKTFRGCPGWLSWLHLLYS